MSFLLTIKHWLEVISGEHPLPQWLASSSWVPILRGVLWACLFVATYAFIGAETKFVYIDF